MAEARWPYRLFFGTLAVCIVLALALPRLTAMVEAEAEQVALWLLLPVALTVLWAAARKAPVEVPGDESRKVDA